MIVHITASIYLVKKNPAGMVDIVTPELIPELYTNHKLRSAVGTDHFDTISKRSFDRDLPSRPANLPSHRK